MKTERQNATTRTTREERHALKVERLKVRRGLGNGPRAGRGAATL